MPNSTTQLSIMDRALQILGYGQIQSPQQVGSRGAKAMQRAYTSTLLSELQKNYWAFSIKRAQIAADGTPPVHTKENRFKLPGDYLMMAPEDQQSRFPLSNDWIVEGGYIISDDDGPIKIRYVSSSVTEADFDAIFAEAFAAILAVGAAEELTNSSSKLSNAATIYDRQIEIARKRNFILTQKPVIPVSSWISARG